MKIGIIGAGGIGRLYATLWQEAGHEIFLSSRNPEDHRSFVKSLGGPAQVGTSAEAAAFADVILLAVNYATVDAAVTDIEPHTHGKLLIDATNPLVHDEDGSLKRMIGEDELAGVVMAAKLPEARIAKALTTLWTGHVEQRGNVDAPTVAMPYATDAAEDKKVLETLIAQAGLDPVDFGALADSAALDPGSPIWNVVLTKTEVLERAAAFKRSQAL